VIINVLKLAKLNSTNECRLHDAIYTRQEMYTQRNSSCTFTLTMVSQAFKMPAV